MKPLSYFLPFKSISYALLVTICLSSCFNQIKNSNALKMVKTNQKLKRFENSFSNKKALNYCMKADSAELSENIEAAKKYYQKAIELEQGNPYLHAKYASFLVNASHKEMALNHITKAIQLKPDESEFWTKRACYYVINSLIDKAESDLKQAKQLKSQSGTYYFTVALLKKRITQNGEACLYADSAALYADDIFLSENIRAFRQQNCGPQYYYHKISPYNVDPLGAELYFYNAVYDVTQTDEPHERASIAKKDANVIRVTNTRDKIMIGVKNFIKSNHHFFEQESVNFLYYRNDGLRHLVVDLPQNSGIECDDIEDLFTHMKFSEEVVVVVMNGIDNGQNIY